MSTLIERLDELKKQLMATTNFHPYAHVVIEARAALDRDFENELHNAFKRGLQAGNEQADKQQQAIIELDVENARLRAALEKCVAALTDPAGMNEEIARDKEKFRAFMDGCDKSVADAISAAHTALKSKEQP